METDKNDSAENALSYLRNLQANNNTLFEIGPDSDYFKNAIRIQVELQESIKPIVDKILNNFRHNIETAFEPLVAMQSFLRTEGAKMSKQISEMFATLNKVVDIEKIAAAIVELEALKKSKKFAEDELHFFSSSSWIRELHDIISKGHRSKLSKATIVSQMIKKSRTVEFEKVVQSSVDAISSNRRRRKIIFKAYECHVKGDYEISIPMFLIQIEGVLTDYLLLKKYVEKDKNKRAKLYLLDKDGKRVKSIDGFIEKINHLQFRNGYALESKAKTRLKKTYEDYRNAILHGDNTKYAKPLHSLELLVHLLTIMSLFD